MRYPNELPSQQVSRTNVLLCLLLCLIGFAIVPLTSVSQRRQTTQSIEAEDLITSARASVGQVTRQDMSGFGRGWSRNAQLFWAPPLPADKPIRSWPSLTLSFNTSAAGTYELILHYTTAPDFAMFRVSVDRQQAVEIDAYSANVSLQSRSLGQQTLSAGNHVLMISLYGKARASRGFAVGLDRLELQPVSTATPSENVIPDRRESQRSRTGGPQIPLAAQLNFALVSSLTQKWTEKGGTERPLDRGDLTAHLVWQSAAGNQLAWRWQVARQPFSTPLSLTPDGLVAQKEISASTFAIDFGSFPPLDAVKGSGPSRQSPLDLYIRLVGVSGGQPVGASNVVVARYRAGSNKSDEITKKAFEGAEEAKKKAELLKKAYSVEVVAFKPAMFSDPNKWGCVYIIKNNSTFAAAYPPGEHCGKSYKGQSYQAKSPWDYITGWSKALEIASDFYEDAKKWTAKQFAEALPCEALGKAGAACEQYATELAGVAINVGLAAVGVPPTLPNLNELAKGQAVDAGVAFTCTTIENQGGKCSPKLRDALKKAYGAGLDKLEQNLDRVNKEPGCGNEKEAHEHGREPLPCFGKIAGVEFRAADGAVYQPPMVTVRITRNNFPVAEHTDLVLRTTVWLKNRFPGGTIETYYQPVPPTDLAGELFVPGSLTLAPLAVGQSVNLILPMGGIKQYTFSSTQGGYAVHNGWCALYNGGTATVLGSIKCRTAEGAEASCGVSGERTVQMPKDGHCSVGG